MTRSGLVSCELAFICIGELLRRLLPSWLLHWWLWGHLCGLQLPLLLLWRLPLCDLQWLQLSTFADHVHSCHRLLCCRTLPTHCIHRLRCKLLVVLMEVAG